MGPSHDNLFVGYTEDQFFNRYNGLNPELYMVATLFDHCIGATSSAREGFIQFIHAVNSCHSPLTFFINVFPESKGPCTSVYYSL